MTRFLVQEIFLGWQDRGLWEKGICSVVWMKGHGIVLKWRTCNFFLIGNEYLYCIFGLARIRCVYAWWYGSGFGWKLRGFLFLVAVRSWWYSLAESLCWWEGLWGLVLRVGIGDHWID